MEAARQAVGRTKEELAKAQAIIDSLQGELARLRGSSAVGSGANGDD